MAKRDQQPQFNPDDAIRALQKLPPQTLRILIVVVVVAAIAAGVYFLFFADQPKVEQPGSVASPPGTYQFCTWNVENFFDDHDDPNNRDEEEDWFGNDPSAFRLKADHLATALLMMNDGRGPDILAVCEVENERCLSVLRDTINARLEANGKADSKYDNILFVDDHTGRRFAPGILTRLPVDRNRTRQLKAASGMQRMLLGHVRVNEHDLTIIAAHWTSRVGRGDTADKRMLYAQKCYGETRAILTANPDADVIVCGDFNDEFADPSLQMGLHATDSEQAVLSARDEPLLLDLCARFSRGPAREGTISYNHKWQIFDHICITRGLLDSKGWSCDPKSTSIFAPNVLLKRRSTYQEPFNFGRQKHQGERGYSDHLPVLTQLRVEGGAAFAK